LPQVTTLVAWGFLFWPVKTHEEFKGKFFVATHFSDETAGNSKKRGEER
jgi:hypothetical protein